MGKEIQEAISAWFPDELIDPASFDDWCSRIREDVMGDAANVVALLDEQLSALRDELRQKQNEIHRDFWERFGGDGDKVIKSVASIRSKLARDLLNGAGKPKKLAEEELCHCVYQFSDLGRVRIVADFPSDIDYLQKRLLVKNRFLGRYVLRKGIKDFVFNPGLRDGLKGHRARQFSVRVPNGQRDFGFEIQLMTRLQHAWDRRNHPLYEWQRENPNWQQDRRAVELGVDDFACAEALHLVDRQADRNWLCFLKNCNQKERA